MSRRDLRYSSLDDVLKDLELLASKPYSAAGKWDLSQICEHLSDWMSFPMTSFPKMPWFISIFIGLLRTLRGKAMLADFTSKQRMPTGQPTVPTTVHEPNENVASSVQRLRDTINKLKNYSGPITPSPMFGAMTYDQLVALQIAHCAHHLSFLTPIENAKN